MLKLLFISLLLFSVGTCNRGSSSAGKSTTASAPQATGDSAIIHYSPQQSVLDSIKAAKTKEKLDQQ